jgi:hypothetical protein
MRTLRVWMGPLAGLVVVAALVVLLKGGPKPKAQAPADSTVTVFSVDPTAVTEIDITSGGKSLTLVQKPAKATGTATAAASPTTWAIGSATGQTADSAKVGNLISLLDPLQANRSLGVVSNPADYGLGKPATVLKVTERSGTVLTLEVGAQTPVGGYYATTGDGKVVIIDNSVEQALVTDPAQWLPPATGSASAGG